MNSSTCENRQCVRKILEYLESRTDVIHSLNQFRDMMRVNYDNKLTVLVLQKVHGLLHSECNIEYVNILMDIVHTEDAFDEVFKIIQSFGDKAEFTELAFKLRDINELIVLKYMKEFKKIHLLREFIKEMDKRYDAILSSIDISQE
ncbi:hypothetical protein CWI42_060080 [Ordospora colligata]|uniref:Uncharacterized protein n=1 Tax=Ordospora colligata OC4 TaxID=1354746 RepID=A0A0B2UKH3_9MICR|nr:uncharacterized protein M896_060080 [Ordospora colligata OC4]KHN69510.1 hypothetical protein M896_060080 [Ordospora colligata OC4]TBU15330.1 hypothetical protein CWI41_060070 [Ordospora colligata]TBU15430.1 hypothetical protein CWI40_060070 [Ordospora colligata]TBU18526.1 hypothetical protein CWI42_060080 [Ordospora colligata]